jgi:hypothetical protein
MNLKKKASWQRTPLRPTGCYTMGQAASLARFFEIPEKMSDFNPKVWRTTQP